MAIAKIIEEKKPSEIRVLKSKDSVVFIVEGSPLKANTNEKTHEAILELCRSHKFMTEAHQTQGEFIFQFDWTNEATVREVEMKISRVVENHGTETVEQMLQRVHEYMLINHSLEIILTSSGIAIIDNIVTDFKFEPELVRSIHNNAVSNSHIHIGNITQDFTINDKNISVVSFRIGDQITLRVKIALTDHTDLSVPMANEMKHRLSNLDTGIIVCANHNIIGMEYAVSMMQSYDPNFTELCAEVGETMVTTDLPSVKSHENFDLLKDTHYRYVIISEDMIKEIGMGPIFELMLSGKVILLSYNTHSIYSLLYNIKDSIKASNVSEVNVLMNTIGFVFPDLAVDEHGTLSLNQTEAVTLTTSKIRELLDNSVSRERFSNWVEFPALVYGLGSKKAFLTQEEEFNQLLAQAIESGSSDIHLAVGARPKLRIQGVLQDVPNTEPLTAKIMDHLCSVIVKTELHQTLLDLEKGLYLPYSVHGLGRFRVQISTQRGTRSMVCRHTTSRIPTIEETQLPMPIVNAMLENPKGLIIVSGPTNSGKSTTSAVLIDQVSKSGSYAITSLADPIEYLHSHGKGIVTQREIPSDVKSYEDGLMSIFRSDPDVIEVAEMRSPESVAATLRFASSGHLVISTWHAPSVIGTLTSLLNRVEPERANELREILSHNLIAIVNQTLVPGTNGKLYPIFEYLIPDNEARMYILDNQLKQLTGHLKSIAATARPDARYADYELIKAFNRGFISEEVRDKYLVDKSNLEDVINDAR